MPAIAAYPMYHLPEMRQLIEQWWQGLNRHLVHYGLVPPEQLGNMSAEDNHWLDADLFLSQTCGFPLTHELKNRVRYVATPCYATPYTQAAHYCSVILVEQGNPVQNLIDTRAYRVAINSKNSQSGFNALRYELAQLGVTDGFFSQQLMSGSHANSIALIVSGKADLCAVDCVTYSLLQCYQPQLINSVRVLQTTALTPGLPLITAAGRSDEEIWGMRAALQDSLRDSELLACHKAMFITDYQVLDSAAYELIKMMENESAGIVFEQSDSGTKIRP